MRPHLSEARYHLKPLVRVKLKEQGRKSSWLASQIGVSKSHLSHMLAGRKTIGAIDARVVAAILGGDFFLLFELPDGNEKTDNGMGEEAA